MKREIYLYSILGFFTLSLIVIQFNLSTKEESSPTSKIENLTNVEQLMINVKSNIYLVEGEIPNILVEGPGKILKEIETIECDGCLTIKNQDISYLSMALNLFNSKKADINIYITLPDLELYNLTEELNDSNVKFTSVDRMGLYLPSGKKFILESKKLICCL